MARPDQSSHPAIRLLKPCGTGRRDRWLFARYLVVHALDVEVHAQDLPIVEMVAALAFDGLSALIDDRALEWMQAAVGDRRLGLLGERLHVVRHVGIGR